MSDAEDIEARAAEFLMRRDEPEWSASDQAGLDAWLRQSAAHQAAFWRLEYGYARFDRMAALGLPPARKPRRWNRPASLAAGVLLALVAGWALLSGVLPLGGVPGQPGPIQQYATNFGSVGKTVLPDGSRIELNTASNIRYSQTSEQRTLWLDRGEAYFEITHDPRRPFTVLTGPRNVTVLGTKFVVTRAARTVTVSVLDGRVRLEGAEHGAHVDPATLTPGQTAIAGTTSTLIKSESLQAIRDRLAWRDGVLKFDGTTIGDAAGQFNRYNVKKLVVGDPETAAIRIGGSFHLNNVEGFARLLETAYGLHVETGDDRIVVSAP